MTEDRIPEFCTVTEASRFTGMDQKTVKKRIENLSVSHVDGRKQLYSCFQVLKNAFVKASEGELSSLNLTEEKAGYYHELTLKTRLEREKLSDKYVDHEEFKLRQSKRLLAFREKLLNVSRKLASKVTRTDPETAFTLMNEAISEALDELIEEEIDRIRIQNENLEERLSPRGDAAKCDQSADQPDG